MNLLYLRFFGALAMESNKECSASNAEMLGDFELANEVLKKIKDEVVSTNDIIPTQLPHFYPEKRSQYAPMILGKSYQLLIR